MSSTTELAERLGIFARTFRRDTPAAVAAAVAGAGFALAHWNFAAIGRQTLAGDVADRQFDTVRRDFDAAGVSIPSVSATYNVIHPDRELRDAQTGEAARRQILTEAIDLLGPRIIGAQAKDVVESGYSAAGAGLMDYHLVLSQLARVVPVPLIVQDADETDAARVRTDLLRWHDEAQAQPGRT